MSSFSIKRVTIHGFKSYDETVTFGPFSNGLNAVVGLNGSGKSNFYNAIEFVLLDEFDNLRPGAKKSLLHEGTGTTAPTAFVEIVFNNEARVLPIEKDEISIRRSISIQKDEYFINRTHATRQEVRNLLETAGFSPAYGYYIVKQGKIGSITTMKDADRLELLLDVAGVRIYESQKADSDKIIKESNEKKQQIKKSIDYIKERIERLESEKKELEEFNCLDKKKRAAEILIQQHRTRELQGEIDAKTEEKEQEAGTLNDYRQQLEEVEAKIADLTEKLNQAENEERRITNQQRNIISKETDLIKQTEKSQLKVAKYKEQYDNAESLSKNLEEQIASTNKEIEETREKEKNLQEKFEEVNKEKSEIDGRIGAINQLCNGAGFDDIETIKKELKKANERTSASKKSLDEKLEAAQNEEQKLSEIEKQIKQIRDETKNLENEQRDLYNQRKQLLENRKLAWVKQSKIEKEINENKLQFDKLKSKMNHQMKAEIANGIEAVKNAKPEGFLGVVIDLIKTDLPQSAFTVAGSRLNFIVVDTTAHAQKIDQILKKQNCAGSTFILDIFKPTKSTLPDNVDKLINHIQFDEQYRPIMEYIFGGYAVSKTIAEGNSISESKKINVVTVDGDIISASGLMIGGSFSERKSPLLITSMMNQKQEELEKLKEKQEETKDNLASIKKELSQVEAKTQSVESKILETKESETKCIEQISEQRMNVDRVHREYDRKKSEFDDFSSHQMTIENRLSTLEEMNGKIDEETKNEAKELLGKRSEIDSLRLELIQEKTKARSRLRDYLIPLSRRLRDQLEELETSRIEQRLNKETTKLKEAEDELEHIRAQSEENQNKLEEAQNNIREFRESKGKFDDKVQSLTNKIIQRSGRLDRIVARISILEKGLKELKDEDNEIGPYPEDEIKELDDYSMTQLYEQLHELNESLKEYRYVNKKAIEQYEAFSSQRDDLLKRMSELEKNQEGLIFLEGQLNEKEESAIENTIAIISDKFSSILAELVPGSEGVLSLYRDPPQQNENKGKATGVGIHVKLGSSDVDSLTIAQLSGGQKSLVALAFVFAIQQFQPAPFYLLDEVDAALDSQHREAVASTISKMASNEHKPAQFILTTFKEELLRSCEKFFGIKSEKGHSIVKEIDQEKSLQIIQEKQEAQEE